MLRIDFKRGQNGKLTEARCRTPDGDELAILGEYDVIVRGRREKVIGGDGLIYRMIAKLADRFAGERFEAHDGRMLCLEGVIDKLYVPVKYGGIKKED